MEKKIIVIWLKNGDKVEVFPSDLEDSDLTLYGHFKAIICAYNKQKVYNDKNFFIDTKDISCIKFNRIK